MEGDFSLYLHRPSATDRSMAPEGCDCFYVLAPVPNQASGIDWETTQSKPFRDAIMRVLEKRFLPDLAKHLVSERILTPLNSKRRLTAIGGSGFSFEPIFRQSAWFRPHNESEDMRNLFLVGAGTYPGAGVLSSAKNCGAINLRAAAVAAELLPLYRRAAAETAGGSKSFYFATQFFPPEEQ
jgi:phytoene desaturase